MNELYAPLEDHARGGNEVLYLTWQDFFERAKLYFQWVKANPIIVEKPQSGRLVRYQVPRAMTLTGLRAYTGDVLHCEHLAPGVQLAVDLMNEWNLTLGLAEVLNPMLIARTMGLPDKIDVIQPGAKDPEVQVEVMPWKR